eukprot:SAG31_NODE_22869_length_516_cov_0.976019_2_plen_30_part_01
MAASTQLSSYDKEYYSIERYHSKAYSAEPW